MEMALKKAMADPKSALNVLDILDSKDHCSSSFYEFVKQAWPVIEPNTTFVEGDMPRVLCHALECVTRGLTKRIVINVPPGCSKSIITSVLWPAWEWGACGLPHHRFINASYEKGLAIRDLVKARTLVTSEWYQERWPIQWKQDQAQKTYYENTMTGWRLATSVGGALTGYRGDRIVIDDPHDVKRAESDMERAIALRWFTETVPTRLNNQKSAIVIIMQRLHEQDVTGLILEELADEWDVMIMPMRFEADRRCNLPHLDISDWRTIDGELLWPERFPEDVVASLERALSSQGGDYAVAGQLQQRPAPRGGGMFKVDNPLIVSAPPDRARRCRGWDLAAAASGDYTVGGLISLSPQGRITFEDVVRFRAETAERDQIIAQTVERDGVGVVQSFPQDPAAAGKNQVTYLAQQLHGYNLHFSPESGDKKLRAIPLASQWGAGNVDLLRAGWNNTLLKELSTFPGGRHDDQIDALSRAYAYLLSNTEVSIGLTPGRCY